MPGLFHRLWNALAAGTVTAADDSGTVMRLQVKLGYMETHTLPSPQQFGFSSVPPVGSDVAAHYIGGDRSNGVITATNHQPTRPAGKLPGESQMFDAFGKSIYMTESSGIVVNANNSAVTVNNATAVTINASSSVTLTTPVVNVSGNLSVGTGATGSFTSAEGRVVTVQDGIVINID